MGCSFSWLGMRAGQKICVGVSFWLYASSSLPFAICPPSFMPLASKQLFQSQPPQLGQSDALYHSLPRRIARLSRVTEQEAHLLQSLAKCVFSGHYELCICEGRAGLLESPDPQFAVHEAVATAAAPIAAGVIMFRSGHNWRPMHKCDVQGRA